jgi:putative transposase
MLSNPFTAILEFIAKDQVEPSLLAQIDYLRAENRILSEMVNGGKITKKNRIELATLGQRLKAINRKLLDSNVQLVKPETLLRWHRELVAQKFDGSGYRKNKGATRVSREVEQEILDIAKEDPTAGYRKIVGYLKGLGKELSHTTIRNILKKHGFPPAPKRRFDLTWKEFIDAHLNIMWGCDFFTHEVWSKAGPITYYILVFIHLGTRRLEIVNMTTHPTQEWTAQQARNFLYDMDECSEKANMRYLLHDGGPQFRELFKNVFTKNEFGEEIITRKVSCAQMNGHCERVIQSIQNECTDRLIFWGDHMLRYALKEYQIHYNEERYHQGLGNVIPFPTQSDTPLVGERKCKTRLGGILRHYYRDAA